MSETEKLALLERLARVPLRLLPSLLLLFAACQEADTEGDRVFHPVRWDTIAIYGSPSDTVLMMPEGMRGWGDGVVVLDSRYSRVTAFDGGGHLRWVYRATGQGPGELLRPSDAYTLSNGDVVVLDRYNLKVVTIDPEGQFVRERRLSELNFSPTFLLPSDETTALAVGVGLRPSVLDIEKGTPVSSIRLPLSEPVLPGFRSITYGASDATREVWVLGMRFGPDWWVGRNEEVFGPHSYVEEVLHQYAGQQVEIAPNTFIMDPSSVDNPDTMMGPTGIAVDGDEVFMISGGSLTIPGVHRDRLDVYSIEGRYLRTHVIPVEASNLVKNGSRFFFLRPEPYPQLLVLEMREGSD